MVKPASFHGIKALIENGKITLFSQIFSVYDFPITPLATFLGTNYVRLKRRVHDPGPLSFNDANRIAGYFEVDPPVMHKLIYADIVHNKNNKKISTVTRKKKTVK